MINTFKKKVIKIAAIVTCLCIAILTTGCFIPDRQIPATRYELTRANIRRLKIFFEDGERVRPRDRLGVQQLLLDNYYLLRDEPEDGDFRVRIQFHYHWLVPPVPGNAYRDVVVFYVDSSLEEQVRDIIAGNSLIGVPFAEIDWSRVNRDNTSIRVQLEEGERFHRLGPQNIQSVFDFFIANIDEINDNYIRGIEKGIRVEMTFLEQQYEFFIPENLVESFREEILRRHFSHLV